MCKFFCQQQFSLFDTFCCLSCYNIDELDPWYQEESDEYYEFFNANLHDTQHGVVFLHDWEAHPYHLINPSPWPVVLSFSLPALTTSFAMYFHSSNEWWKQFMLSILLLGLCLYSWFYDIMMESKFEGSHGKKVQFNLETGMILFIVSEVLFFFSFFWSYFHSALVPTIWMGEIWPPVPIKALDAYGLPFFNTILLISSGFSVTWAHSALFSGQRLAVAGALIMTVFYGLLFTAFQMIEYNFCEFSICDTVYGSTFFLLTGFHGLHVMVGTIMLLVVLFSHIYYHIDLSHHMGFEVAMWYWHFVDVVWLFLYMFIYILVC